MIREELVNELFCQPAMIDYSLQGYWLYWCRPHTTFKLCKEYDEKSINGVPITEPDLPNCMAGDGEMLSDCDNVHVSSMTIDDLCLAIRVMGYMQYERDDKSP